MSEKFFTTRGERIGHRIKHSCQRVFFIILVDRTLTKRFKKYMNEEKKGTEAKPEVIPPKEEIEDDNEARILALEKEKAKLIEESANYRVAYLKEKSKKKENPEDEGEEDTMRRIAREELAGSRLVEIAQEQDQIIKKALKENKELKLAHLNKTNTPPSTGVHSEGQNVKDTLVTDEQLAAFKARGWDDKQIERYKKNLLRYRSL